MRSQMKKYFHVGYPPLYFFYNMLELAFPRFTAFYTQHGPMPFLKSTFLELWEKEGEALTAMSGNRFRSETDLTPYLFREYQKLTGRFHAMNIQKNFAYFPVAGETDQLVHAITRQKKKILCVNDGTISEEQAKEAGEAIRKAFGRILPEISGFERGGAQAAAAE